MTETAGARATGVDLLVVKDGAMAEAERLAAQPRILVAEDEYFIAADLADWVRASGGAVVGPVARVSDALSLLGDETTPIDIAILDLTLQDGRIDPVADRLVELGLPFLFATGYDVSAIPARHAERMRWTKPYDAERLVATARMVWLDHRSRRALNRDRSARGGA